MGPRERMKKFAQEYRGERQAINASCFFRRWVMVRGNDEGPPSFHLFESAFAVEWTDSSERRWYFVYTEHEDYHFFSADEYVVIEFEDRGKMRKIK